MDKIVVCPEARSASFVQKSEGQGMFCHNALNMLHS